MHSHFLSRIHGKWPISWHIVLIILISLVCSQSEFWRLSLHLWDQNMTTLSALWVDAEVLGCRPLTALHPSLREPVRTQARTLVRAGQSLYGSDSLVLSVAAVWFRTNHVPFLKYMMFNVHLKNYLFIISIFVPLLCLHCLMGFSLVTPSGDSSAAVVPGRLVAEPLLLRSFPYWARALGWAAFSSCLVRAP